jgi:hypothetical protein
MEELYPGKSNGLGFKVGGFARTYKVPSPISRPREAGEVIAGFYNFGPECFFVHQNSANQAPSFVFRPLTAGFLRNAIGEDGTFEFSLMQRRLGDVKYLVGAAARDTGEISQGILSLHASGGWGQGGLRLHFVGELYENSAFLNRPTPKEYKQASYEIELNIPWMVLRFMFYNEMGFVLSNYELFCSDQIH